MSLFEAVAALAIVSVTAISALAAAGAELRTAARAQHAVEAEALLAERVTFLELLTDRDLQRLPDSVAQGRFDAPLEEYGWTTASTPSGTVPGLYDVQVSVQWPTGEAAVSTALYRRPPLATRGGS